MEKTDHYADTLEEDEFNKTFVDEPGILDKYKQMAKLVNTCLP